ncbi:WW domain binding protein 11-domain-containing protein [Aspergillus coremiiformis]|uniref:WW domain binding protein 11-domain-containing protein n=1 Tax=Aspergillus coremiiformis TaxID=138285 RepID=A0A5N6YYY0_9EURO|nr:WW domain binding protein 11-domain-containing protein [Aspergillus coremiiformis]
MPKERNFNPVQAQRKADKQKSLKKSKAEAQVRQNEKLARRNPERIQRQINDFKAIEESGQQLRPRDKEILEALERDLRAVQKAREALGDKAPKFENAQSRRGGFGGGGGRGDGVLGKRRRGDRGQFGQDSGSSETDEEVRRIPMPRDTPPPIPRQYQKKREGGADTGPRGPHALPAKPVVESRTVYEAKPEIKDLRKEAVRKFVPAAVRVKQEAIRGQGKLLEPEEMDKLEKAGYNTGLSEDTEKEGSGQPDDDIQQRLFEEEKRFNQELRSVQIEDVEDEEA